MASPNVSDNTVICDDDTMTGGGFLPMIIPPIDTGGGAGVGRDTIHGEAPDGPPTGLVRPNLLGL